MKTKKHRFFFHFNKITKQMTVHYRKQCLSCKDIICCTTTETKYNKTQPFLVMQGMTEGIVIQDDTILIK